MDNIPFEAEGFSLVRAEEKDMDYILYCVREDILCSVPADEKDLRDLWIDDIIQIVEDAIGDKKMDSEVFVLRHEGKDAGMLWMGMSRDQFTCDETGYLLGIFVEPELRGRGLGKELVRAAERWCSCNHLLSMSLNVGTENEKARRLYQRMGYTDRSTVMRRMLR